MKRSYKKLLIFQLIMFLILILNSFIHNILGNYSTIIFLVLTTIAFKFIFGIEKDRHRFTKDIIFDVIIFLLTFFLLYYLSGIIIGFARTDNYYNVNGIITFIIPIIITTIVKEFLRYQVIMKSEGSRLLTILTCILFIFLDVTNPIFYNGFASKYDTFIFFALTLLPAISSNIVCSYLTYKVGYKPNILYLLVINLYQYLLPLVPNPNEYLASLVNFLLPILLGFKLSSFFNLTMDEEIERDYNKKGIISLIIPTILVIILVYFTSGYFHYYAVAIASGSMEKVISKGDIVVIEKLDAEYEKLKEGQVIAYTYNGVLVVHRIVRIIKQDGQYYVYTKGDANPNEDNYVVEQDTIMGTVKAVVPYLGLPTVWLNEI
ncbi:MAG: signal peptidase I [Bacilli bacterium]|nr:signal peptidase I [Bacilli bacterium]